MDQNLQKIKQTILKVSKEMNIEIEKIILFGSRARGDYREDSDYDILIITKEKIEELDEKKYWNFYSKISDKLIRILNSSIDLIIVSKNYFENEKNKISKVYYWAEKEGIII